MNREFTTLDKYGTHTIKVSEIYNGNIAGENNSPKAATLFENKAGDEEEATEGKVHIGDYVNYNPIANGDTGTESKYKYQSLNDYTGVLEAIVAGKVTGFSDSSQNFTVKSNLKWQVIGIDGDNILITPETPIVPDNPVSVQMQTGPSSYTSYVGYALYGAKAYLNVSQKLGERNEINNIAQIYKYGKGSDSTKARGMTISDVNKVTGITIEGTTITPNVVDNSMGQYGNSFSFEPGSSGGWSPETWIDENRTSSTTSPGISGTITEYIYQGSNASLKTSNSSIRNKLIFGDNNSFIKYWLASRGICQLSTDYVGFGPGYLENGYAFECGPFFYNSGMEFSRAYGVRPVIYLVDEVSLTSAGTTGNITTWNID